MSATLGERLAAFSVPVEAGFDVLDLAGAGAMLWSGRGESFAGFGAAARIDVHLDSLQPGAVASLLARLDAGEGPPPLAFGALPFVPSRAGELVVPSVLFRQGPSGSWLTLVGRERLDQAEVERLLGWATSRANAAEADEPRAYRVRPCRPPEEWRAAAAAARDAIVEALAGPAGALTKVVLARDVVVEADAPIDVGAVARRLHASLPGSMLFALDGFVGSSPELLVERRGETVRSHPVAGTVAARGRAAGDREMAAELLRSGKDRHEHAVVVDAVAGALGPLCGQLDLPGAPELVEAGPMSHLGTAIAGTLSPPAPSALDIAGVLHPTPAVAGTPTPSALAYIEAHEGMDRGRYAGPVGWVDAAGDGCFAVAIRSAEVSGRRARLFAGAGIVAASDPDAELAETQLKLQPVLNAIVRP